MARALAESGGALERWAGKRVFIAGVKGETGVRLWDAVRRAGVDNVTGCDIETPMLEIQRRVANSDIAILAVPETAVISILSPILSDLGPGNLITEFGTTKIKSEKILRKAKKRGIDEAGIHIGIIPSASLKNAPILICRVGQPPDGEYGAVAFADALFRVHFGANTSIIDIRDHRWVQVLQIATFVDKLSEAGFLKSRGITLADSRKYRTASGRLAEGSMARILGQKIDIIAQVLNTSPEIVRAVIKSKRAVLQELEGIVTNREKLEDHTKGLQQFHGGSTGELQMAYDDAGLLISDLLGTDSASLSVTTENDAPGSLVEILTRFLTSDPDDEAVSLMSIRSRRRPKPKEAVLNGADARAEDVVFKIGVPPDADQKRLNEISEELREIGCTVEK